MKKSINKFKLSIIQFYWVFHCNLACVFLIIFVVVVVFLFSRLHLNRLSIVCAAYVYTNVCQHIFINAKKLLLFGFLCYYIVVLLLHFGLLCFLSTPFGEMILIHRYEFRRAVYSSGCRVVASVIVVVVVVFVNKTMQK